MATSRAPFPIVDVCQQQIGMVAAYDSATSDYRLTVERLHSRLGVVPKDAYETIRRDAEATRARSEHAHIVLERHITEPGC